MRSIALAIRSAMTIPMIGHDGAGDDADPEDDDGDSHDNVLDGEWVRRMFQCHFDGGDHKSAGSRPLH